MPLGFGIVGLPKRGGGPLVKPAPGAVINPQHPLAQGMVGAFPLNGAGAREIDYAKGLHATVVGGTRTAGGWASPNIECALAPNILGADASAYSVVHKLRRLNTNFGSYSGGTPQVRPFLLGPYGNNFQCGFQTTVASRTIDTTSFNTRATPFPWFTFAFTFSNGYQGAYLNGKLEASTAHAENLSFGVIPQNVRIGAAADNGVEVEYFWIYSRALNPSEIGKLHAEPYCMFWLPGARTIFIPVETGGTVTHEEGGTIGVTAGISGAATVELQGAGTIAASVGIEGAGTVDLVGSGTIAATTGIEGAATVQLEGAGTITATAGVSGAATVQLEGVGTITVTAGLEGEWDSGGPVTHQEGGTIGVTANVSGAATVTLEGAGTITVTAGIAGEWDAGLVQWEEGGSITVTAGVAGDATVTLEGGGTITVTAGVEGDEGEAAEDTRRPGGGYKPRRGKGVSLYPDLSDRKPKRPKQPKRRASSEPKPEKEDEELAIPPRQIKPAAPPRLPPKPKPIKLKRDPVQDQPSMVSAGAPIAAAPAQAAVAIAAPAPMAQRGMQPAPSIPEPEIKIVEEEEFLALWLLDL